METGRRVHLLASAASAGLLLTASPSLGAPAAATGNLAANPGFEQWPDKPADNPAWGATHYQVGVEGRDDVPQAGCAHRTGEGELDTELHSGKYAQYIQTTTWGRGAISRGIPVTPGHRYRTSVWVKLLSGKFQLGVCFSHAPWTYLGGWAYGEPNAEWTQISKEILIPPACRGVAVVMFLQSGTAYLDDLEVVDLGVSATIDAVDDKLPLLGGRVAERIVRTRVALFHEPEFPSESPRPTGWYDSTLTASGLSVTRLSFKALADPERFSREQFDTLLLPTGGNFPSDAEAQIEAFLAQGGTLVIDESVAFRTTPAPEDVREEIARRKKAYEDGAGGFDYFDYCSKHMWTYYGNMFHRDAADGTWRPTLRRCQNYETVTQAAFPYGLDVFLWPNYAAPFYARPFDEPVRRNPGLAHMLGDFPAEIPADANPTGARGAIRLRKAGGRGFNAAEAEEFACDLLLPLYLFDAVSGRNYPAFPDAGKHERDRETDFYILRYHSGRKQGGTLVHFGVAGARLLRTPQAAHILLACLRLAESELPGECPSQYVQTANDARHMFSEYAERSTRLREQVAGLARCAAYTGEGKKLTALRDSWDAEQRRFESLGDRALALEKLLLKRDDGCAWGHGARQQFVEELRRAASQLDSRLERTATELEATCNPPADVRAQSLSGYVYIGLDNAHRRGQGSLDSLRQMAERLGLRFEGYQISSYRHEYTFNGHPFKTEFDSGVLDPSAGTVTPKKYRWIETERDWERWSESFSWQFQRARSDPDINSVFGLDESDLEWSLWGPRTHKLFLAYLQTKYAVVEDMNAVWNAEYATFGHVQLPVRQPVTQAEHALWEDWTRFREVHRRDAQLTPIVETVRRYGEGLRYFTWCTYNQHHRHPANGINFYEYGKALQPFGINGFEHSNREDKEWLVFDICGMFTRNCTAEWGTFYFPPAAHQEKIDLLTETVWKGLANGQAGWCLFSCSQPGSTASNFFDMVNRPLPLGWQLAQLNRHLKSIDHVVLDGEREEPQVRILYSPTTRRHTSWPGVEGDISYRAVSGLYSAFKNSHLHARAIDEQAVWEGHLHDACRLLILPEVLYEQDRLHRALRRYVESGGNLLVTPGTGRFDQYGRRRDSWLVLAGVVPTVVKQRVIRVGEASRYFSAGHADKMLGLQPVFPDDVTVLHRFTGGEAALTETRLGKGRLFVLGADLGLDCHDQWKGSPSVVDALLAPVFESAGVVRDVLVSEPTVMVRPWRYKRQRFLFLASRGRGGLREYDLAVRGDWRISDYLLGVPLDVRRDGEFSRTRGLIASPGGVVLELAPSEEPRRTEPEQPARAALPRPPGIAARDPQPDGTALTEGKTPRASLLDPSHPFVGRLWARDGTTKLGEFEFELDVETGGGWGGKAFLALRHGRERLRQLCLTGKDTVFHFTTQTVRVFCEDVVSVYPVNLNCEISVAAPTPPQSACRLRREAFHGTESLVLTNGLLTLRLLPKLGGRMIELVSLPDGTNHAYVDRELAEKGVGPTSVQLGGMKENPGGYPGPYMAAEFAAEIVTDTPDRVTVRLAMTDPADWGYGYARPKSGRNRLEKEFELNRGESAVHVRLQAFNEAAQVRPTGLRTHPQWVIGGDGDAADRWIYRGGGKLTTMRPPFSGTIPAEGDWTAIVDSAKRAAMIQTFSELATESVYTCGDSPYNLELWAKPRDIEPGQALHFSHSIGLIRGLAGICEARNGTAVNILPPAERPDAGEQPLSFDVEVGSITALSATVDVTVERGGRPLATMEPWQLRVHPGRAATRTFPWPVAGPTDAEHAIVVRVAPDGGDETLIARRAFHVGRRTDPGRRDRVRQYRARIAELKRQYLRDRDAGATSEQLRDLRGRIVRAAILLGELRSPDDGAKPAPEARELLNSLLE